MTDDPYVPDDELPYRHNPIQYLPWLDTRAEIEVFQHRAGQTTRLAEWCGGQVTFTADLVVRVPNVGDARLGDFVLSDGQTFWIESSDGFFQRYWPVGKDPGWSHRCYMPWEE